MSKRIIFISFIGLVFLLIFSINLLSSASTKKPKTICTADAKICPDGSSVSRSGPNCEFASCPKINSLISESDARAIAQKKCLKTGESLTSDGTYNPNSQTWWFDANLKSAPKGCDPACVVNEKDRTAEINWRCTGARE